MPSVPRTLLAAALVAVATATSAGTPLTPKKTVCTITVNSDDEKETLRARLPKDKFSFVELVEHGRPDWLASSCHKGVQCDILVISGHFAGTNFFSEEIATQEFLPVEEMERVSCSDSCPGLFSKLKEVYLFGCNTLNGETFESQTAETARALMRDGVSKSDAERKSRELNGRYGETNRDRMRRIFANVPVIYGFSAKAPIGAVAAGSLSRYLAQGGGTELGSGHASGRLLGSFGGTSFTSTSGVGTAGPQATYRREVCQFYDDRKSRPQQVEFLHSLFERNMAEVRMFLGHIEQFSSSLSASDRASDAVRPALERIAADTRTRERYLEFTRDVERPEIRARMVKLAGSLAWLDDKGLHDELTGVVSDLLARKSLHTGDVDFVCALNEKHDLDAPRDQFRLTPTQVADAGHAAALACLGNADDHARMLAALSSPDAGVVQIAQVYFGRRPLRDTNEIRQAAASVARMPDGEAKVVALETLAKHYLSDRDSVEAIASGFTRTGSLAVQRAIAGILLRADAKTLDAGAMLRMVADHRVRSSSGRDIIDVLVKRLQTAATTVMAVAPRSIAAN